MGPDAFRDDPSQYAGEDTRLTSKKELSGWYAYSFAAEVFVICGIGESVSPSWLCLELRVIARKLLELVTEAAWKSFKDREFKALIA